jgi:hypothetical protein
LTQLLCDVDIAAHRSPVTIVNDNQGTIALYENRVHHQRSKHINIKHHFVRDEYRQGKINVMYMYMPSKDMIADIFTKPASKHKLSKFKNLLFGK